RYAKPDVVNWIATLYRNPAVLIRRRRRQQDIVLQRSPNRPVRQSTFYLLLIFPDHQSQSLSSQFVGYNATFRDQLIQFSFCLSIYEKVKWFDHYGFDGGNITAFLFQDDKAVALDKRTEHM